MIYASNEHTFIKDVTYSKYPKFSKLQIQYCIDERNRMIKEIKYTSHDWDKIDETAYHKVMQLCVNLFIATINGDEKCKYYFSSIRKDFDIVNAGELSEICITYEHIVTMM